VDCTHAALPISLLFLREESCWQQYLSSYLQDKSGNVRYSASNPLHRTFHFSALCHGDDGVVGRVVVCGCVPSSVFSDGDVGIIAVEISRAGLTTTVFFSCILDICGAFAASSMVCGSGGIRLSLYM
jgi:hypothetical protein